MRGTAIAVALLLALSLTGSLGAPTRSPAAADASAAAPGLLPADFPDAELLLLLAREIGLDAARPAAPLAVPPGVTLPGMVHHLAARAGAAHRLAPEDLLPLARLDPRVEAPVTLLLVAIDRAWDQRDHAFRDVPPEDLRALARALHQGRDDDATRALEAAVLARTDAAALLDAAILLLDTLEAHVLPALQHAIDAGAWPPQGAWDPAGVLRLGSTGDDLETMDRIVQIDPRGNDEYRNNAGGTTVLGDVSPMTLDSSIAISVDFSGNDRYSSVRSFTVGAGFAGIGALYDSGGSDRYSCRSLCLGSGSTGVGIARDQGGDDEWKASDRCMGFATLVGVLREDGGNDGYFPTSACGGVATTVQGIGVLWDRAGSDLYESVYNLPFLYGWGEGGGIGAFADEGAATDFYSTADPNRMPSAESVHGCNDCRWTSGAPWGGSETGSGRGSDNQGGFTSLFS